MTGNNLIISLYGEDELLKRFGTIDISYDDIVEYKENLVKLWNTEYITIRYSESNLRWVVREGKRIGRFKMHWIFSDENIIIRTEDINELIYLKLSHRDS